MYSLGVVATGTQRTNQIDKLKGTGVTTTSSAPPGAPVAGGVSTSRNITAAPATTASATTGLGSKPQGADTGSKLGFSPSTPAVSTGTISTGGQKESLGFGSSVGKADTKSTSGTGLSMGTPAGNRAPSASPPGTSSGGSNATRRAEGGLITKPEKTSRNKKGLAS
jgi:hypothetical protein